MNKYLSHCFAAGIVLLLAIYGQAQTPTPSPDVGKEDVVVITTNLVQIDATVTDKNGNTVKDLTAKDFEIYENDKKQEITAFSFIESLPAKALETIPEKTAKNLPSAPPLPARLRPEQVRRTIALVVDDLGLSFESMAFVRQALKKFVDEQMQPGDLVAIIRTGGGIGALQQFTSDKQQLYAAIERVRWNPQGRGEVSAFAPIESSAAETVASQTGAEDDAERARRDRQSTRDFDNFRTDIFSVGTLGALNFIVKGMGDLPGRKSVILLSDGFRLFYRDEDGNIDTTQSQRVLDSLRRLTDLANRASVVVNTIDARGLQGLGLTAADDVGGLTAAQIEQRISDRRNEFLDTQEGLTYLAQQTGGRSFINNNDIKGAITKVLDEQRSYYLLGYEPDEATFDPAKRPFNKLMVKVLRPGLKVRYRSGFFGIPETERDARPAGQNAGQRLLSALTSPFGASGIGLRLNTLFANDPKTGSFIRSLIHVQAKDLKFTEEPDGTKKVVFDAVAFTFGDNGVPVDQINRTYTMGLKNDETFRRLLEKGFIYYINIPVKKPGAYQLRVALRDAASDKIGAANQFVEVPSLKKNRLTLSGIVLQNLTRGQYEKLAQNQPAGGETQNSDGEIDPQTDTALRRFRRGTILQYGYTVYNAKLDSAKRPQLETQMRIFRDGKLYFEGRKTPVDPAAQTDLSRINLSSAFSLPSQMEPGDYVLQIVVADALAKEKRRIASQWIEFEIVN